jgi:hypothetical protein
MSKILDQIPYGVVRDSVHVGNELVVTVPHQIITESLRSRLRRFNLRSSTRISAIS